MPMSEICKFDALGPAASEFHARGDMVKSLRTYNHATAISRRDAAGLACRQAYLLLGRRSSLGRALNDQGIATRSEVHDFNR